MNSIIKYARFLTLVCISLMAGLSACDIITPTLGPSVAERKGTKKIDAEWLVSLPNRRHLISSLQWLDENTILYSTPSDATSQLHQIETLSTITHARQQIGQGAHPLLSPDGNWIAYIFHDQLWIQRRDGSEKSQLTHISDGLKEEYGYHYQYAWAPDSSRLAICYQTVTCPLSPFEDRKELPVFDTTRTSAIVASDMKSDNKRTQIDLIDCVSFTCQKIATFDAQIDYLSWHPNNQELLFTKIKTNCWGRNETTLESLPISHANSHVLMQFDGLQQFMFPTYSPNGDQIAVTYDADNPVYNHMMSLVILPSHSSQEPTEVPIERLTYEMKVEKPEWSHDGSKLFFLRSYGPYRQIYSVDRATRSCQQITHAALQIGSFALSANGSQLVWYGIDAQGRRCIQIGSIDGQHVRDLLVVESAPHDMALSEVREIEWQVPDYPVAMRGLLFMPLQHQKETKYPLIVDIHGGGAGANIVMAGGILVSTPLEWHYWTAKGYAVFVPEFRSSCCFGSLAITRDDNQEHHLIKKDVEDIVAGVDMLIKEGIVDPKRTACIGHSAGARRVNWLTVATHRFSAVISKEGWADDWLELGIFGAPSQQHPVFQPEKFQRDSALFHALGATTPTLFLLGNTRLGGVDFYDTVRWLYNALKAQNVKAEYVQYPDEGHCFERPANRLDALERTTRWLKENM